jgi:hypothetical protein
MVIHITCPPTVLKQFPFVSPLRTPVRDHFALVGFITSRDVSSPESYHRQQLVSLERNKSAGPMLIVPKMYNQQGYHVCYLVMVSSSDLAPNPEGRMPDLSGKVILISGDV